MTSRLTVTAFCGMRAGAKPAYCTAASDLGRHFAAHDITLIFGGGQVGVMGALADAALAGGGQVVGVAPQFIKQAEELHPRATQMITVPDMQARKRYMFDNADAFCILSGGLGTLDELFAVVTLRQLKQHYKPIILLNTSNFWDPLLALLDSLLVEGFIHETHAKLLTVVQHPEDVISALLA
jgi:uncharacterized protein (TIGR00730 family)